jgi:hypothetical protein
MIVAGLQDRVPWSVEGDDQAVAGSKRRSRTML